MASTVHYNVGTLYLENNSIDDTLYLGKKNSIGDEGATALAEALKVNTTINDMYLGKNSIGDEGATALAEALKVNTTITTLDLRNNSIGDEGKVAVLDGWGGSQREVDV